MDVGAPFLGGGGVGQHLKSHHGARDARDSSGKGVDEKMVGGGGGSHRNEKGSTLAAFSKDVGAKVRDGCLVCACWLWSEAVLVLRLPLQSVVV